MVDEMDEDETVADTPELSLVCEQCGVMDASFEEVLSWDENQVIACTCKAQLVIVAEWPGTGYQKIISTVGDMKKAIDEVLGVVGGTVQ